MINKCILVFLCCCGICFSCQSQDNMEFYQRLVPFCNHEGKWGYMDAHTHTVIINPAFDDAQPYQNGYAVAAIKGKYGVLNEKGKAIVPFSYPFAALYTHDAFTLLITKKEYNAWWRFSKWKILPEYNILSTGNSGPFLVTRVPSAVWEVRSLPGKKTLYRSNRLDDENYLDSRYWRKDWIPARTVPNDITISSAGNILLVSHYAYLQQPGKGLKRIPGNIFGIINDSAVLAGNKTQYVSIHLTGKRTDEKTYTQVQEIPFTTSTGNTITVKRIDEQMPQYPVIDAPVFKDQAGKYYLFPDLTHPVPTHLQPHAAAGEILRHTIILTALPHRQSLLIYTYLDKEQRRSVVLLKEDGSLHIPAAAGGGLDKVLTDGRMLFSRGQNKGVLDTNGVFYQVPLEYIEPCQLNRYWYMGKDPLTQQYGVYDAGKQVWKVPPAYSYLQNELAPGIAIYSIVKTGSDGQQKEWYGLLDIAAGKRVTGPVYDRIEGDGKVQRTIQGRQISCYINPSTGEEYTK